MSFAVFTMVGPGEIEAGRLLTLLASLFRHEPATSLVAVVDDSGGDVSARLKASCPPTCDAVRLVNPAGQNRDCLAVNTMIALRHLTARHEIQFAMKLDTDALVIGPFSRAIADYFDSHSDVGQVGRAERRCDGSPADNGVYVPWVRRSIKRLHIKRTPRWGVGHALWGDAARFRRLLVRSAVNGVGGGLHCQGGAYAISRIALDQMQTQGLLGEDGAARFCGAEDLLASTLVGACGLRLASLTRAGEPFGVEHIGLPYPPAELAEKGYAVIHSIKNDPSYSEDEIVRFFGRNN